jgi:Glycosyl transferase family 2
MNPLITICIPAYNAARYLPATLAGVRDQTFPDWELIVTEDGSKEDVEAMIHTFARTVSQPVIYQRHEENQGLPATRNTAIASARGEWIALLDSDDLWTPGHLASLVAGAQQQPAADFVHAGSVLFESETGRELEVRAPSVDAVRDYPRSLYLGDYIVQPSSVMLKKQLWARVRGFNPAYRYVEDREMWLRCARAGAVFAFTGRNTCLYRRHATALTTHAGPMAVASARVLDQHLDWDVAPLLVRRRITAEAWISAGRLELRSSPATARRHFARAWRVQPSARLAAYRLAAFFLGLGRKPDPAGSPPGIRPKLRPRLPSVTPAAPSLPLCLLIPAGPGPEEIARIADLLEACAAYSDLPLSVVIINDGNDAAGLEQAGRAQGIPTTVRPNARDGHGNWWTGGLCMAMVDALLWIARHRPCCGVLRLDSDALVINPFARQLVALFQADPFIGMVGNGDTPTGAPPPTGHSLTAMLYWKSKPVSHDREHKKIIVSLWGWRRRIRRLIHRAQQNGYVLGDWCQGGAYAVSPTFLARLREDPAFASPGDFLHLDFCEDVLMILIVHALGLRAHYTTGPARLFASKWKGLYAAPAALAGAGHGVIHSIKEHGELKEADIRSIFRARRSDVAPP